MPQSTPMQHWRLCHVENIKYLGKCCCSPWFVCLCVFVHSFVCFVCFVYRANPEPSDQSHPVLSNPNPSQHMVPSKNSASAFYQNIGIRAPEKWWLEDSAIVSYIEIIPVFRGRVNFWFVVHQNVQLFLICLEHPISDTIPFMGDCSQKRLRAIGA